MDHREMQLSERAGDVSITLLMMAIVSLLGRSYADVSDTLKLLAMASGTVGITIPLWTISRARDANGKRRLVFSWTAIVTTMAAALFLPA